MADSETQSPFGLPGTSGQFLLLTLRETGNMIRHYTYRLIVLLLPGALACKALCQSHSWTSIVPGFGARENPGQSAVDSSGNIYVGLTSNQPTGGTPIVVVKHSSLGAIQWSRIMNGPSVQSLNALKCDSTGNVVICGYSVVAGQYDAYVAKLNTAGTVLWSYQVDRGQGDLFACLTIDSNDNIILAGSTDIGPSGEKWWTRSYSPSGALNWEIIEPEGGGVNAIAVDSTNSVFVTGHLRSGNQFDFGAAKYSSLGTRVWGSPSRKNGGANGNDWPKAIAVDASGRAFCAGWSNIGGDAHIWLVRFNADGSVGYETNPYVNGGAGEAYGIGLYGSKVFVAGYNFNGSNNDAIMLRYDQNSVSPPEIVDQFNGVGNGDDIASSIVIDEGLARAYLSIATTGPGGSRDYQVRRYANITGAWTTLNFPARTGTTGYENTNVGNVVLASGSVYLSGRIGSTDYDEQLTKYLSNGTVVWETPYGMPGKGDDYPGYPFATHNVWKRSSCRDSLGNTWVAGNSDSFTVRDWLVTKTDANGSLLWKKRIVGSISGEEFAYSVDCDQSGNAYVVGRFWSPPNGSFAAIVKLDSNGNELWRNVYGNGDEDFKLVKVDNTGAVYAVGGDYGVFGTSVTDVRVVKYSPEGAVLWTRAWTAEAISNSSSDVMTAITIDSANNLYLAGYGSWSGDSECVSLKISADNSILTEQRLVGASAAMGFEFLSDIVLDSLGNVYVCGRDSLSGNSDFMVAKLSSSLSPIWSKHYNGTGNGADTALAVACDPICNLYVTGSSAAPGGQLDALTLKYSPDGQLLWENRYDASGFDDAGMGIAVDNQDRVYVCGYSTGLVSGQDGLVTRLSAPTGVFQWADRILGDADQTDNLESVFLDAANNITAVGFVAQTETLRDIFLRKYYADGVPTPYPYLYGWGANYASSLGTGLSASRVPLATRVQDVCQTAGMASDGTHALMRTAGGNCWAWGVNDNGQVGDGTNTSRTRPVQIPLSNVTKIAAGQYYSLALLADATVRSWGFNADGRLGDGTTNQRNVPVVVAGLANVVDISAGWSHALAVLADGTVRAWGVNAAGQLGKQAGGYETSPIVVRSSSDGLNYANLANVTQVAAGRNHSLALLANGTVVSWGSNTKGQLGDPSTGVGRSYAKTVPIAGLTNIVAIAAGENTSYALGATGLLYAWGANTSGQIGDGTTRDRFTPVLVKLVGVTQIAAGAGHAVAITGSGSVWTWGSNAEGQLGTGNFTPRPLAANPAQVNGGTRIAAGGKQTFMYGVGPQ